MEDQQNDKPALTVRNGSVSGRHISAPLSTPVLSERLEDTSRDGVVAYFRMVVRHKFFVVAMTILGTCAGILLTLPQVPVYQSRTSLEVEGLNENFLNMQNLNPTSSPNGYVDPTYEIMTQVKVMQSESLLERAVQRLRVEKNPQPFVPADPLAKIRKLLRLTPKPAIDREQAIRQVASGIQVKGSDSTRIIEVTADSSDPRLAADFANILVDEFIEKNLDDRWKTIERTGDWLSKQLGELKVKLEESENAMQGYAASAGLQFTGGGEGKDGGQENVLSASVRLLQEQLLKARADRMVAQSRYDLIASSPAEALPQVLDDPSLREYETKLVDLKRQRAELTPSLTPDHPRMQKIDLQIAEIQKALSTARDKVVMRLRNEYSAASSHEKMLDDEFSKELNTVSSKAAIQAHYDILKREVETNRQLYENMLARVKETSIAAAMHASNFRIVDPAKPAGIPYKPNATNNALLGTVAGIFFGILIVFLREHADRSIQQPGDCSLYLGIQELAVIPSDRIGRIRRSTDILTRPVSKALRSGAPRNTVELVTWQRQSSLVAESFRTLLTSIMFSDRPPRVLIVASPNPKEGKTTVASNLAIALSETNQRVLLIDADMRRPRLHRLFEIRNEIGLSKLLRSKTTGPVSGEELLSATQLTWIPGLRVLTSGPWAANLSTLLYSNRLSEIIEVARENFDTVIIDTPPMLAIADGRILAKHADSVLMVLRAGKTTRSDGQMAIQRFSSDGSIVLGTVLLDWDPRRNGYGYDYKYYSRHAAYYTDSTEQKPETGADQKNAG